MIQLTRDGFEIAEEETDRIYAEPVQGEQSIMVQSDMKAYGLKTGLWPNSHYDNIMGAHADARGWTQEGFTGMEIIE
tara:strand:- start:1949 stop:2179 length:231 start_codon:yes stop_codon:yes gene_type:complete